MTDDTTFEQKLAEARVAAAKEGIPLRDYVQREHRRRMAQVRELTGGTQGFLDRNFRKPEDES